MVTHSPAPQTSKSMGKPLCNRSFNGQIGCESKERFYFQSANQFFPIGVVTTDVIRKIAAALLFLLIGDTLRAQTRPEFHFSRAMQPPKVDGRLDDDVWNDDPLVLGDWISYNPLYGEKIPQRTEVRISYDERNLYFAFHCFDNQPEKIRTTVSRRDSVFSDDWVGFSLDSNGTGQTSYHLIVNPSGIQMDAINTSSSGERWEADLVWDSAGRLTEDGYAVEIKLPLQSIRLRGGKDVKMG